MSFIYDLDNENGGAILSDLDTTAPALQVNSNAPGYPGIASYSTASGYPIEVKSFNEPVSFKSTMTVKRALQIGRTVNGTASVAPVLFAGASAASGAVLGFTGCISLTSIVFTTVANTDYAIPVEINGEARYIPVFKAAALIGAAVFT
jgi:hypothetical protein